MVLEQKYIKDSGYEMEDEFMDALHILNPIVSYKIGKFIEDNVLDLPPNPFTSYVLGGIVHHNNKPYPFALEIIKEEGFMTILSNLIMISLDDYLDLINLNTYIKSNETNTIVTGSHQRTSRVA
jgi:hypothetical protein|tara:strand:+ start:1116 stop:1487 length:372 start_codon:yes stop_codon:yes gene_type:complete